VVVPGADAGHPVTLAERLTAVLPRGQLAPVKISTDLRTAEDLADTVAPAVRDFLADVDTRSSPRPNVH